MNLKQYLSVLSLAGILYQSSLSVAQDYVRLPNPHKSSAISSTAKEMSGALILKDISRKANGTTYRIYFENPVAVSRLEVTALKSRALIYRVTLYSISNRPIEIREFNNSYIQDSKLSSEVLTSLEPIKFLDIWVESYREEADLLLQVFSNSGSVTLSQEAPLDESNLQRFTRSDWRRLAERVKNNHPTFADLNDTQWVCSVFSPRTHLFEKDRLVRQYFSPNGKNLQSSSSRDDSTANWIFTKNGWTLPVAPVFIRGATGVPGSQLIRKISQDSIIEEIVATTRDLEAVGTPRSEINHISEVSAFSEEDSQVDFYRYCRRQRL